MNYKSFKNSIIIQNIKNFNIEQTLDCGQCFRWNLNNKGMYQGIAFGKLISIYKENDNIIIENTNEEDFKNIWVKYFDLSTDYSLIKEQLCKIDPLLEKAARYAPGIRILNQDPWEALCSFVISQNNNIPRIKGIISRLCENFGEEISENEFSFPSAKLISKLSLEDLAPLRCGFRASYILDAANKVASKEVDLEKIECLSIEEGKTELLKIKGVGPKVAECTLLYGFHKLEAFPVDVWMKKAMQVLFPNKTPEMFGKYAGIAQQYIFHYSRNHPELFS